MGGVDELVVDLRAGMGTVAIEEARAALVRAAQDGVPVLCVVHDPDLAVVDLLARLELLRRSGLQCRVVSSGPAWLSALVDLVGLAEAGTGLSTLVGGALAWQCPPLPEPGPAVLPGED